jgi:hypothetical protein
MSEAQARLMRPVRIVPSSAFLIAALQMLPPALQAQQVECLLRRVSDGTLGGSCSQAGTMVGQVTLRPPAAATPYVWLGVMRGERFRGAASGAEAGETEIGVDVRPGGALRVGRDRLAVSGVKADSASLRFVFTFDGRAPADQTDAEIIRRARAYLGDPSHWNRADTTDMEAAPVRGFSCAPATKQSMFCALYLASIAVAGDYAHFRPAMNAVRQAVDAASPSPYRHPLVDFNNDPRRTLDQIQAVLDAALALVSNWRSRAT